MMPRCVKGVTVCVGHCRYSSQAIACGVWGRDLMVRSGTVGFVFYDKSIYIRRGETMSPGPVYATTKGNS